MGLCKRRNEKQGFLTMGLAWGSRSGGFSHSGGTKCCWCAPHRSGGLSSEDSQFSYYRAWPLPPRGKVRQSQRKGMFNTLAPVKFPCHVLIKQEECEEEKGPAQPQITDRGVKGPHSLFSMSRKRKSFALGINRQEKQEKNSHSFLSIIKVQRKDQGLQS